MTPFYHLGFVVSDLDAAVAELEATLGVRFNEPREWQLEDWPFRIVFSVDGPPFLELVEGPPGSPWDASEGSRFDHLGYWTGDLEAARDALARRGAPVDFDATPSGRPFTYHRLEALGARAELVDAGAQPGFVETWAPGLAPMPVLGPPPGTDDAGIAACRDALLDFLGAIDHGHATTALDLFTPDADFAARGEQLHGREQIATFLAEREAETDRHTVHVVANERVRRATADEVVLDATLLLHEREAGGTYAIRRALDTEQTFRRDPDRWRIAARSTRPIHPG